MILSAIEAAPGASESILVDTITCPEFTNMGFMPKARDRVLPCALVFQVLPLLLWYLCGP